VRYHEQSINVVCVGGESSPSRGKGCLGRLLEICLSEGSQTSERGGHRTKTQSIADNLGNASSFISIRSFACARRLRSRHFRPRAEMRFTPPFHSCKELLTNASSCIQLIDKGVIVVLSECLASEDEVVQERAAHDINIIITIVGSKGCENLLRTGAVENLILLLSSSSENVRHATYDVLMNACKRSSEIQYLLCDMKGLLENLLLQVERMGLVDSRKALGLIRTCLAGRRRPGDDVAVSLFLNDPLSKVVRSLKF